MPAPKWHREIWRSLSKEENDSIDRMCDRLREKTIVAGFAESLSHPRGNMTGLTFMAAELNAKRLEILRDMIPDLQRVAIIANPEHPGSQIERTYSEEAARKFGLRTEFFGTASEAQLSAAFATMDQSPPQAISLFADGFAIQYRQQIIDYGMKHRAGLHHRRGARRDALVVTRSNYDSLDADTTVQEFALQLDAGHLGHIHIHDQAIGQPGGFPSRRLPMSFGLFSSPPRC
jgi:ABC transporter substrate binding protein